LLFTEKYKPKRLDEIIGNKSVVTLVRKWAENWANGIKQTPILLYGPPGVGKTALGNAVASEFNWEIIETNASDVRKKKSIEEILGPASTLGTLTGKQRLIIIDEVDGINTHDRGAVSAIGSIVSSSSQPVILIANDPYKKKFRSLQHYADLLEMKKVAKREIMTLLKKIANNEDLYLNFENGEKFEDFINEIAENSNGDVRSAIVDLQKLSKSVRDREIDIFKTLGIMFKSGFDDAKRVAWSMNVDLELLILWVDENIPNEYTDPYEIYQAYETLSKATLFEGRIKRRQYWKLRKYAIDLATGGVASAKRERYQKFTKYRFPSFLKNMYLSQKRRSLLKSASLKIGKEIHMSSKDVKGDLIFILPIILKNPEKFHLEKEEVLLLNNLFNSSQFSKKIKV